MLWRFAVSLKIEMVISAGYRRVDENTVSLLGLIFNEIIHFYRDISIDYFYTWAGFDKESHSSLFRHFFWKKKPAPLIFYENELARNLIEQNAALLFYLGNSDAV